MAGPAAGAGAAVPETVLDVAMNPSPTGQAYTAHWTTGTTGEPGEGYGVTPGATDTLRITLPPRLQNVDTGYLTWTIRAGNTPIVTGGIAGSVHPTFSVPFDSIGDATTGGLQLFIDSADAGHPDRISLGIDLARVPASDSTAPIAAIDLGGQAPQRSTSASTYRGTPSPLTIVDGATVAVHSPPGFWTTGPAGEWPDAIVDSALLRPTAGPAVDVTATVSDDGAELRIALPENATELVDAGSTAALAVRLSDRPSGSPAGTGTGVTFEVPLTTAATVPPTVDRVAGSDRYDAAVNISRAAFPGTAPVVVVTSGTEFPDALSGGPAAAALGGPLLLTQPHRLPSAVRAEIQRLQPARIVVVGGPDSVSVDVVSELESLQEDTVRVGGADRYEASRNLARFVFAEAGASTLYVATGSTFSDALSAGAAAASAGGPVVLVIGEATALDSGTVDLITDLGVEDVVIAGGPASVTTGVEESLATVASTTRRGGADRYEASASINAAAFPSGSRAFLATGEKFPDALAGAAWAGALPAPLYLVQPTCVPLATLSALQTQGARSVILLGGPDSLSATVQSLSAC